MKTIIAIFALALVACSASPVAEMEVEDHHFYDNMVHNAISEAEQLAHEIVSLVEQQVMEIVMYPVHQLEAAVADIEARRAESEECVNAEVEHTSRTINTATSDFYGCGSDAKSNSVSMVVDTKSAVYQLTFDGYALTTQYRSCRKISNSYLKKVCQTKLTVMVAQYAINTKSSIKTLRSLRQRAPGIATDAQACTYDSRDRALSEFSLVIENIDTCIYNMVH